MHTVLVFCRVREVAKKKRRILPPPLLLLAQFAELLERCALFFNANAAECRISYYPLSRLSFIKTLLARIEQDA